MKNYLEKENIYLYDQIMNLLLDQEKIKIVLENFNMLDKSIFNNYKLHGIKHAVNVALLSLIISYDFDLTDCDRKILIDAALLHDIGRIDDYNDENHAKIGAILANTILTKQPFYKNNNSVSITMLLIESHNNIYDESLYRKYNIDKNNKIELLKKIIVDADTLDRVRLELEKKIYSNKLKLPFSKNLLDFAHYLNKSDFTENILEMSETNELSGNSIRNN